MNGEMARIVNHVFEEWHTGRMRSRCVTPVVMAIAIMLGGCASNPNDAYFGSVESKANVYVAPQKVKDPIHKVAIMPFKAPTDLIGASVSDLLLTEFMRAGRYEMVERGQMSKVLSETELSVAGLSAAKATEVGQMLGAEGVIIGTVDDYSMVAQRGRTYAVVGISARLIDCSSGKVIWSVDLAERAEDRDTTLPEQVRIVIHKVTAALYQHWKD